jgi:hypothetical protein
VITLGWNYLNNEMYEETIALIGKQWPEILEKPTKSPLDANELNYTILMGYALFSSGSEDRGNELLDIAEQRRWFEEHKDDPLF